MKGFYTGMIAGFTYYQLLQYFVIYSFAGWCVEVIYQAAAKGIVVNRGFLNGPVCPIYGFGVIAVFALFHLSPEYTMYDANVLMVFVIGVVLATAIELFGGWALDKIFHARWWDYTGKPFNFRGYICLEFSLIWGLGIVFVVKVVQPAVARISAAVAPESRLGWAALGVVYTGYAFDVVLSAMIMIGLNKKMAELDEMRRKMRVVSDGLSRTLGEGTLETVQQAEEAGVQAALVRAEIRDGIQETSEMIKKGMDEKAEEFQEELKRSADEREAFMLEKKKEYDRKKEELFETIRKSSHFGLGRLLRAFPQMEHRDFDELLKELQKRM